MSTPTPQTPAPAPAPAAPVTKPELKQVSNYVAVAVATVGNLLPYVTPDLLTSLGVSAPTVHAVSTVVSLLLLAYREKIPASK